VPISTEIAPTGQWQSCSTGKYRLIFSQRAPPLKTISGFNTFSPALIQASFVKYYLSLVSGITRSGVLYATGNIADLRNAAERFRRCRSCSHSGTDSRGCCLCAMGMVVSRNRLNQPETAAAQNLIGRQIGLRIGHFRENGLIEEPKPN
jgi:hypothetical protein